MSKFDPSRTKTLRDRFERDARKRWRKLRTATIKLIVKEDAFGLKQPRTNFFNVVNTRWSFHTDSRKVDEFEAWLRQQYGTIGAANESDAYWNKYIEEAYDKGAGRAFDDSRIKDADSDERTAGAREEFLRRSFGQMERQDKIKLLAGRTFTDLKGVNEAVAVDLRRKLVDGLARGANPREIAREIANGIDSIGRRRAETIARTEIIRAHSEGQLDAYEALGAEDVAVAAEWNTAGDDRVCPLCGPLDGVVLSIKDARGQIPRHPNCRCAFIPADPDDIKG